MHSQTTVRPLGHDTRFKVNLLMACENSDPLSRSCELVSPQVRLNGYERADKGTEALLVIMPKVHLGWCTELQEKLDGVSRTYVKHGSIGKTARKTFLANFGACMGKPRSLVKFERIFKGIMESHTVQYIFTE